MNEVTRLDDRPSAAGATSRANGQASALSPRATGRWVWRTLTSMRTALLLLLLLALAAVPGSLIPQVKVDSLAVRSFATRHPDLTPWLDRLGMFSVYNSSWFSAIYLLLLVSLVGCIVPRASHYARALRAGPPAAPRNLSRLPHSLTYETDEGVGRVLDRALTALRRDGYRVELRQEGAGVAAVAAQRGYAREAGNLLFHVGVVVVLVGVAGTSLFGYKAGVIVVEGGSFSNTLPSYDEFSAGALFTVADLRPFSFTLDDFEARFETDGPQAGAPRLFEGSGTYTDTVGGAPRPFHIEVNSPVQIGGADVFLIGSGYAPVVTVRDGRGDVVLDGPVPFLPTDASYTSEGVVKVPDAHPTGLGFKGVFLPTAVEGADGAAFSAFPDAANPVLNLFAYSGDLGLDVPQSVYTLNTDNMTPLQGADGQQLRLQLSLGQTARLPDGLGSITFQGVRRMAKLQVTQSPGKLVPLVALVTALVGLVLSLYVRPRRTWVRARRVGDRTVVEVAGLDRVGGGDLGPDLNDLVGRMRSTQHLE